MGGGIGRGGIGGTVLPFFFVSVESGGDGGSEVWPCISPSTHLQYSIRVLITLLSRSRAVGPKL